MLVSLSQFEVLDAARSNEPVLEERSSAAAAPFLLGLG
jgi:hypothetical protein